MAPDAADVNSTCAAQLGGTLESTCCFPDLSLIRVNNMKEESIPSGSPISKAARHDAVDIINLHIS